jgi:hypothetical protein
MSNGLGRMIFVSPTADMCAIRVEIKRHESRHPTMNPLTGFNPLVLEQGVNGRLGSIRLGISLDRRAAAVDHGSCLGN